jgi:hypothetical protein
VPLAALPRVIGGPGSDFIGARTEQGSSWRANQPGFRVHNGGDGIRCCRTSARRSSNLAAAFLFGLASVYRVLRPERADAVIEQLRIFDWSAFLSQSVTPETSIVAEKHLKLAEDLVPLCGRNR